MHLVRDEGSEDVYELSITVSIYRCDFSFQQYTLTSHSGVTWPPSLYVQFEDWRQTGLFHWRLAFPTSL